MTTTSDGPPDVFVAPGTTPPDPAQPGAREVVWGDEGDTPEPKGSPSDHQDAPNTLERLRQVVADDLEAQEDDEDNIVTVPLPTRKKPGTDKPLYALEMSKALDLNLLDQWRVKFAKGGKRRGMPMGGQQTDDQVDAVKLAAQVVGYYTRRIWLLDDDRQPVEPLTRGHLDPDSPNPAEEISFRENHQELFDKLKAVDNRGRYNIQLGVRKFVRQDTTLVALMNKLITESGIYDDFDEISKDADTPTLG